MFPRQLQGLPSAPATRIVAHAEPRAEAPPTQVSSGAIEPLDTTVRRAIEQAIAQCGGNIPKAAAALQVSASTLYRRIQAWQAESTAS